MRIYRITYVIISRISIKLDKQICTQYMIKSIIHGHYNYWVWFYHIDISVYIFFVFSGPWSRRSKICPCNSKHLMIEAYTCIMKSTLFSFTPSFSPLLFTIWSGVLRYVVSKTNSYFPWLTCSIYIYVLRHTHDHKSCLFAPSPPPPQTHITVFVYVGGGAGFRGVGPNFRQGKRQVIF